VVLWFICSTYLQHPISTLIVAAACIKAAYALWKSLWQLSSAQLLLLHTLLCSYSKTLQVLSKKPITMP
jgi:hypothetical protein